MFHEVPRYPTVGYLVVQARFLTPCQTRLDYVSRTLHTLVAFRVFGLDIIRT